MKYLNVFSVYLKRTIRNKTFIFIMILFPIALIWVLGNAFSGMMGDDIKETMHSNIIYTLSDSSTTANEFKTYMINKESEYFTFILENNYDSAMDSIKKNEFDAYVIVSKDKIVLYKNSIYNFNGTMAELILRAYVDRYNMIYEIYSIDPTLLQKEQNNSEKYTKIVSLKENRNPGSMDYYGVTITSMFIFYGLIFISTYMIGDKRQKTKDRIMVSPIKGTTYQWAIISGNVFVLFLQMLLLISLGILVFNTYWGDNILIPLLILFVELVMVSAIGAVLGMLIKSESLVSGISQFLIPVFVFLGDGYVQLPSGGVIGIIKRISPIYWVNHGIFNAIYLNDYNSAYISIGFNISIALICTTIIIFNQYNWRNKNV